jgi:hypothetical protein
MPMFSHAYGSIAAIEALATNHHCTGRKLPPADLSLAVRLRRKGDQRCDDRGVENWLTLADRNVVELPVARAQQQVAQALGPEQHMFVVRPSRIVQ